jgi:hypothetical protein
MSKGQHHSQPENVDATATLKWLRESTDAEGYFTSVARQQQWLRDSFNVQRKI